MQEALLSLGRGKSHPLCGKEVSVGFLSPKSFRAKFIIVVGLAVLFDLCLAGGVALFNVNKLSTSATNTINAGLTDATREYLETYIESTALRTNLLLDQTFSEVETLGGALQTMIDNSTAEHHVGEFVMNDWSLGDRGLTYNPEGHWVQNEDGRSVVTAWGYLVDDRGNLLPQTREQIIHTL
jgi:sigma-B regulation protein RsbU (phosphoserine phosphatase)